jgi:serine/threonine protein kinase
LLTRSPIAIVQVALKKISKRYTNLFTFQTETQALLRIYDNGGHPNISGLRDMYEDHSHFYLILDLINGGEMFDHLSNDGAYSEADAARLMFEISSALAFLHGVGVIHADLKPENLLLCSKNRRQGTIKIIDFGCAALKDNESTEPQEKGAETGTTGYWPPERFQSTPLTPAVDTWAVGVILYIMLTGAHPFDLNCDRSDDEVAEAIKANAKPPLDESDVGHLSESAIDLIKKLMEPDPSKRMTAYELLHHPWVQGETAATEKMEDSDKKLSHFQDLRHKLEASIFAVLVNQGHQDMTMSEAKRKNSDSNRNSGVPIMKLVFDVFDEDKKGYVTGDDIGRLVTEHTGEKLNSKETNDYLKSRNKESQEVSLSSFSKLFSGLKHKHYPRGHLLFNAGDDGGSMYFLSSGKVEIQTRKGQLVSILRSGDFFGEGSLLDNQKKRFTTAKCATPVDVIEIKRDDFDRYTRSSSQTRNELKRKWRARNLVYAKNLLRLQKNVKVRTLKKGDVIYKEGDVGSAMFRVDDNEGGEFPSYWSSQELLFLLTSSCSPVSPGELEVLHGDTSVHKYVAGDSFGESSLLFEKPRS